MFPFSFFKKKRLSYSSPCNFSPESRELFNALKECHLQNDVLYFAKLKKLAAKYPEEPLFFLFAGDIVRKSDPQKALEIHRELLFRNATALLRSMILERVAQDYVAMGENKKAILVLKEGVKCSDLPTTTLSLSKVYERESNYDDAWRELEKYLASVDLRGSAQLATLAAKAANHFLFSDERSKERAIYWFETLSKKLSDPVQSAVADYQIALLKNRSKRAVSLLKELVAAGENWEIAARSLLLGNENGGEINYAVEGRRKSLFHALLNPNLRLGEPLKFAADETLAVKKLTIANGDSQLARRLDEIMPARSLFCCKKCGKHLRRLTPVCDGCQMITERKFAIISEA